MHYNKTKFEELETIFMKHTYLSFQYFSKKNVGKQLKALFLVTVVLPLLFVGSIVSLFTYRQIKQNYEHLSESKAMQIRSVFTTTTIYLYDIYETLSNDSELWNLLSTDYTDAKAAQISLESYSGFDKVLVNNATISSLKLYVDKDVLKQEENFTYYYPITDVVKETTWYQTAASTKGNFWRCQSRRGRDDIRYWELNYYCHIPIPQTSSYAILVLTVSDNHLRSLIQDDDYEVYVSINDSPVFFSSNRQYAGNPLPTTKKAKTAYGSETGLMNVFEKNTIASVQTLQPYATSDQIYILAYSPEAMPNIHRLELVFFLCILFALLISALLIYSYSNYFSARIGTLRLAMHKVSHDDYQIVNSIQGDDELSATFRDLKTMVKKLKKTQAQIYQAKIKEQLLSNQQQQMELKLLANQINPHFLYNTLETIRMKALTEGNREVANAIKLLGKTMRYVLNNTKTSATTLDKELDYIKNYLAIQKMRFGNRLNYTIEIERTLEPQYYKILPLLIQPIIENAISHGLEDTGEEGLITLKLLKSKNDLLIADIYDNGIGMDEETLKDVRLHLTIPRPESEHGVGLYNINSRVHLFYGETYGLTIESKPEIGTHVRLTVPLLNLTEE